jgi:hypothetical protein
MGLFGGNSSGSKGADLNQWWQTQWALPAVNSAIDTATSNYQPYVDQGKKGLDTYSDALGLNGQDAAWAVQDKFTQTPSYQFTLDQGLDAIARKASSRGNLAGGQTSADFVKYAEGLADSEYDDYLDNLKSLSNLGLSGSEGVGGLKKYQASTYTDMAQNIGKGWQEGLKQDEASNNAAQSNLLSGILGGVKMLSGFGGK